jgi:hypothetical protein
MKRGICTFPEWVRAASRTHPRIAAVLQPLRSVGPYFLLELIMPGGTVLAMLLWMYQHSRKSA